jgi:hypothetical protein
MTATLKPLEAASTQLPVTGATLGAVLYTVPAATSTKIESMILTNSSLTVSYVATIYKYQSGDAAGDDTMIVNAVSIPPKGNVELVQRPWAMATGDILWGFADTAAKVTVHISGIEVT